MVGPRIELFGVPVDALSRSESVARIERLIEEGVPAQHVVLNASKVVMMDADPALRAIIASCAINNADGISILIAARILGYRLPERVTGVDLFGDVLELCDRRGWSVFLLGAEPDVVEAVAAKIERKFPALRIAGFHDGFFDDDAAIARIIRGSGADVLFLGMPSPKKEYWLASHLNDTGAKLGMGVGGTFDIWAGKTRRAPSWVQRIGMEWLYRLIQEPRRMWRRYLLGNLRFLHLVMKEYARVR